MTRQFDPSIIREVIAEMNDLTEEVLSATQKVAEERERDKQSHAAEDEERENAARRGTFGPEWQRLQQRMDRGETSWDAVFLGADDDSATQTVVENSFDRLETMISQARDSLEDEDGAGNAQYLEMTELNREIQAKLAHINEELDEMRRNS